MKTISLQESLRQNLTRYFTGKPCKYGHLSERLSSNRTCIECSLPKKRAWNNKPGIKEKSIARLNAANTPAKHLARTRKRQAAKLQRTPKWLTKHDFKVIEAFYSISAMLQRENGIPYHVDHIIPLQGRKVSGLHVPMNLQVLPGEENSQKSNKYSL